MIHWRVKQLMRMAGADTDPVLSDQLGLHTKRNRIQVHRYPQPENHNRRRNRMLGPGQARCK